MELADRTCCNLTDNGSHKEDYQDPYSSISALRKEIESLKTDLEKQAKSKPKPAPVVMRFSAAPFRDEQSIFCSAVAVILFISTPFMIVYGTLLVRMFGVFGLSLAFFFLILDAAVAFNAVEILGTVTFNWCVVGGFLFWLLLLAGFVAFVWLKTGSSI